MALAPLVLSSVGPATSGAATIGGAPSDVMSSLAGHWRCTASNGSVTQRTYVVTDGGPVMTGVATAAGQRAVGGARSSVDTPGAAGTASVLRTVYGRQEGTDTGPSFERLTERSDRSFSVETPEGTGSAAASEASAIRFSGEQAMARAAVSEEAGARAPASLAPAVRPLSLSYAVEPGALHRTVRSGSTTLSQESCMRERDTASASCATANAPAATVHAVIPRAPSGAPQQGTVQMRLVLDDRGRVVGEDVLSSTSPALTRTALAAAHDSTFTAAVQNCRAVFSQHVFAVQFITDAQRAASSNGRETNL